MTSAEDIIRDQAALRELVRQRLELEAGRSPLLLGDLDVESVELRTFGSFEVDRIEYVNSRDGRYTVSMDSWPRDTHGRLITDPVALTAMWVQETRQTDHLRKQRDENVELYKTWMNEMASQLGDLLERSHGKQIGYHKIIKHDDGPWELSLDVRDVYPTVFTYPGTVKMVSTCSNCGGVEHKQSKRWMGVALRNALMQFSVIGTLYVLCTTFGIMPDWAAMMGSLMIAYGVPYLVKTMNSNQRKIEGYR